MTTSFRKHSITISLLLLLGVLIVAWLLPSTGLLLGMIFLLSSFFTASFAIFEKYRKAYFQGKITRVILIRNIFFEITGILLAMTLAGLLGTFIAEIATRQITNDLVRFAAGISIGLMVGIVVGVFVKRASSHLVSSSGN